MNKYSCLIIKRVIIGFLSMVRLFYLVIGLFLISCSFEEQKLVNNSVDILNHYSPKTPFPVKIIESGNKIKTRFSTPNGFDRYQVEQNSFGYFLQNLPLKPHGALVKYYSGEQKENDEIYAAVIDLPIGKKDLHQCADAVMRLRADYLYEQKRYNDIHFNFTNGFRVDYSEYMKGNRMVVSGNKTYWKSSKPASNTLNDFTKYKELIYMYAGTLSLSRELKSIPISDIQIGNVFIQGGSPGHAIIVVDMAVNSQGDKVFMLAQSYMPAQEIQVLMNPLYPDISPWFAIKGSEHLHTPEWNFEWENLKGF
jgi:hypothetical protein